MEPRECPNCSRPDQKKYLTKSEGQLEQSGRTHLPTIVWSCDCGHRHWEPAKDAQWETSVVKDALTGKVLSVPRKVS